jgi:hypothetical protein
MRVVLLAANYTIQHQLVHLGIILTLKCQYRNQLILKTTATLDWEPLQDVAQMKLDAKNAIFWYVTPCDSCKNRRTLRRNTSMHPLLVTANVVPSSQILVTLKMEALSSSETSVLAKLTRRNIPEDGFFIVTAVKTSNLT